MNKFLLVIFILVTSCSHQTKTLQATKSNNAFANEGFIRWTQVDLQRFDNGNQLVELQAQCHRQKIADQAEIQEMMDSFSNHLTANQENAAYWNHIAVCYMYHQDYAKAQFVFEFALNKNPSSAVKAALLNNKGLIQLRLGHHTLALTSFKESIKLSPRSLTPQFNLSLLYLEYGHVALALPILQRLHSLHSTDEEIMTKLGFSYVLMQQYNKANSLFSKLSEPYKRRADVTVIMAINDLEQGKPESARHLMLRQSRTNSTYLKRMSQMTERRINQALENKRVAEEKKKEQEKLSRSTASDSTKE
jgi:tetratricopeptide (TPR) repeat protein